MIACGVVASRRRSAALYGEIPAAEASQVGRKRLTFVTKKRKKVHMEGPAPLNTHYKIRFNRPEMWIPIVCFTFVFGCRWMVGVDYEEYLLQYTIAEEDHFEPLFQVLVSGLSGMGIHYSVFFSVIAFIEIFCIYYAFRNYKFLYPYLAFTLIIGFWFLSLSNILRQQLAACIFLLSIPSILERKPLKFYAYVILAFLFHKSAILLVVVYPILRWKEDWFKNVYWQLFLFAVALFLSTHYDLLVHILEVPFKFVVDKLGYSQYSFGILFNNALNDRTKFGANSGFGLPAQLVKYLPIILYSARMKSFYNDRFFDLAYTLWFVGMFTSLALGASIVLTRPFIYAQNFLYIMPGFFFHYCFKSKKALPQCISLGMIALYLLLFINLISHGSMNTSEFTFFWQHNNI